MPVSQTAKFVTYNLVGEIGETIGKAQQAIALIDCQPSKTKTDHHNIGIFVNLITEEMQRAQNAKIIPNLKRYFNCQQ